MRSAWRHSQRGFTLLETLVAFVLLSLALALIMQIFSTGLRGGSALELRANAAIVAAGVLNSVGAQIPVQPGEQSDASGPYRWRVTMAPALLADEASDALPPEPPRHRVYRVDLLVEWRQGARPQRLEMSTLRLGRNADG